MIGHVRARFMGRFIEVARTRLAHALALTAEGSGDAVAVATELHTLAGEASVLGIKDVAEAARQAETAARSWQMAADTAAQMQCARAIRALRQTVEVLAAAEAVAAPAPAVLASAAPEAGARVLVIDDSPVNADAMVDALREAGFAAEGASTRAEALARLGSWAPAVVVCDLNMEGLSPEEVGAAARALPARPGLLVVSGLDTAERARRSATVGADGHVGKDGGVAAVVAGVRGLAIGRRA